ncbi:helix-turn-helix domain-containing protein [Haliangium ochraceum]|uniref:Two component transcriptional regulator, Fis family n=1 Tax=Haliangium ochraceum (strain DSM 14365 / JCM 11303 / SMP-2) TaxID=502025 RepID=D0LFR8_HALO1|nr:helix-turn-helix domain-containing protein [Haliangium ochraceum]ACY14520.1 two component transcriptional regulator, Fis family [Haliangium ochraceum DSM 14365]
MSNTIALIVDDSSIRQLVNTTLSEAGYAVLETDLRGLEMPDATKGIAAVCLSVGDSTRISVQQRLQQLDADMPVVVTTSSPELGEHAMRSGAYEVLVKPVSAQQIRQAVARAVQHRQLQSRVSELDTRLKMYEGDDVMTIHELERLAIERALRVTRGSVTKAAKLLGIGRATLYRRLASPEMADIRARRAGSGDSASSSSNESRPASPMSAMSQAHMAREL